MAMQVTKLHVALALLVGPLAHLAAGFRGRAAVAGAGVAALAGAWPYWCYLELFSERFPGGDDARELVATCLQANEALLASAGTWLPVALGLLALGNLACALDLALVAKREAALAGRPTLARTGT
jgi:hypothetical protein